MTPLMARAILGADRNDGFDVLKSKWRRLAKIHHPDRGGDPDMFKRLVEAYQFLIDNPVFVTNSKMLRLDGPSAPAPYKKTPMSPYYWSEQEWLEEEFGHLGYWTRRGTRR